MAAGFRSEQLITVDDWSEVPRFPDEAEEAEFWRTHCLGQPLLDRMQPLDDVLPLPRRRKRRLTTLISEYAREVTRQRRPPSRHPDYSADEVLIQEPWRLAS